MIDPQFNISLIICAYTEKRWIELADAVGSIKNQTVFPEETIIVIDHNPNLFERVKREFADVLVINNQEAPGLSGARNSGIAQAHGEIIAFLDEDAVAAPNWLENLIGEYGDPKVMGVGGAIYPMWVDKKPAWFPAEFYWVVGCSYKGLPEQKAQVRNLIGCNMSYRREVLAASGGFRNGMGRVGILPLGCEETELCIRAGQRFAGGLFLYQPGAKVFHRVPRNRTRWAYFIKRCFSEGISKAQVSRFVGEKDGLASERTYTFTTLPRGIKRGLMEGMRLQDVAGFGRALTIALGLGITTAGYLKGVVSIKKKGINDQPDPDIYLTGDYKNQRSL